MKILVIQFRKIGDVIATTVIFNELREKFPDSELHYLVDSNTEAVLLNNPMIDKIILFDQSLKKSLRYFRSHLLNVRKAKYDVVIDVYSKNSSALISMFSKAKIKISYRKWYSSFAYSHTIERAKSPYSEMKLAIENRLSLLSPILHLRKDKIHQPKIYLDSSETEKALGKLRKHGLVASKPIFMISAMGSVSSKSYPIKFLAEILDYITDDFDCYLLLNYLPSQKTQIEELIGICTDRTINAIIKEIYSENLIQFLALTKNCKVLIGNEGGTINMAKAIDIPTFSIYSPWILKEAWNSFEINGENASVHLADYRPDLYNKHPKFYKKDALELYEYFHPKLFYSKLRQFLLNNGQKLRKDRFNNN